MLKFILTSPAINIFIYVIQKVTPFDFPIKLFVFPSGDSYMDILMVLLSVSIALISINFMCYYLRAAFSVVLIISL